MTKVTGSIPHIEQNLCLQQKSNTVPYGPMLPPDIWKYRLVKTEYDPDVDLGFSVKKISARFPVAYSLRPGEPSAFIPR